MKPNRIGPALIILSLLAAFLLGGAGASSAANLTKSAVKKIATKVVAKKAATLAVAHAATADNATNAANASALGGLSAAQLQTNAYRYTLPVQTSAFSRVYTFPGLPAGTYLVSYAMVLDTSTTGGAICSLEPNGVAPVAAASYGPNVLGQFTRCTASAVTTVTTGVKLTVGVTAGAFNQDAQSENVISFVPIATVTAGSATGARESTATAGGAG